MRIVLIHTTLATVKSLTDLVKEEMKNVEVTNILDDSILPQIIEGKELAQIESRWLEYARIAESMDADAIISACSTVGEFAEKGDRLLHTPVYRIDEGMAERAVEIGGTINIYATLPSTLDPTVRLIENKSREAGKDCKLNSILIPNAYEDLMNGHVKAHDDAILYAVEEGLANADVIVLAQASMATAVDSLSVQDKERVLTSPLLGIRKVKKDIYNNVKDN